MKQYIGYRAGGDCLIEVREDGEKIGRPLEHRVRHSPSGFEWGYHGSGPADAARSILFDHIGHDAHPAIYQRFKSTIIAQIPQAMEQWRMSSTDIDLALAVILKDMRVKCPRCAESGVVEISGDRNGNCKDGYCDCESGEALRSDLEDLESALKERKISE